MGQIKYALDHVLAWWLPVYSLWYDVVRGQNFGQMKQEGDKLRMHFTNPASPGAERLCPLASLLSQETELSAELMRKSKLTFIQGALEPQSHSDPGEGARSIVWERLLKIAPVNSLQESPPRCFPGKLGSVALISGST